MKKNVSYIFSYIISFIIAIRMTVLVNINIISKIISLFFLISSVVLIYGARKINKNKFLKENFLIVIYIGIRFFSILVLSEKIFNLKTLFYEIYFLIIIFCLLKRGRDNKKNVLLILIIFNIYFNILTIIIGVLGNKEYLTTVYGNTNTIGNYTCLCILIYVTFFSRKIKKSINYIYIIFSTLMILLSQSRTPIIIIGFYIFSRLIIRSRIIKPNQFKETFMCSLNVFILSVILFSYSTKFLDNPSVLELKLNDFTTNRYYLWKYSIISLEKSPVVGIGENNIGEKRFKEVPEKRLKGLVLSRYIRLSMNNNHNGYIQLLSANGYIAYMIFMYWLYKKCLNVSMSKFYIISAILILNIFETQLIMSANIGGFLLMYLLSKIEIREGEK